MPLALSTSEATETCRFVHIFANYFVIKELISHHTVVLVRYTYLLFGSLICECYYNFILLEGLIKRFIFGIDYWLFVLQYSIYVLGLERGIVFSFLNRRLI